MALLIAYAACGVSVFGQDWKREGHPADNAPQPIPSVTPKMERAPRATLIATPTPVARATLVATPAPVPRAELIAAPAPVPRAELIAIPAPMLGPLLLPTPVPSPTPLFTPNASWTNSASDQLPTPTWHPPESEAQLPSPVPGAPTPTFPTQSRAMPWAGMLLLIPVVAGSAIASVMLNRGARRAAKQRAETPRKPQPTVYHDYNQYQQARQRWLHGNSSFAQQEAARLAALEAKLKQAGPLSGLGCLGFILLALLFGAAGGAGAGWGTVIVGVIVVGLLSACEQQYRRWRWRDQFTRRVFADAVPEPIYEGPSPQQEQPPPPRQEPPPRRESASSPPTREPVRVTSLRQAFEILGIPPGRTTLSVARASYRARIAEYHPDKTMHLGKELQELAARKTLELNLAMKFVEENCTKHPADPGQPVTGASEPPRSEPEPGSQVVIAQILRFKSAVPCRPFSIKTRKNDRAASTSEKWFFIRYPEWVSLKDETSIVLWTSNADHPHEIPLTEIERVSQGVYEAGTHWEGTADRKTDEARSGNGNGAIYPEDSIVSAPEGDPQRIFLRGPFDSLDDDAFCDPYVEGLDYIERNGHSYISIDSWRGRIPYGTDEDSLLGNEILELASRGGWDWDNDYSWEEVYCGGADVIPHYVTKRVAMGLREFLRTAPNEIELEGRTISRDTLLQAASILEAGPTTIPW